MFSIDTDVLKTQAELLQQESRKFNQHLNILDEVIFIKEGEIICQKDADALRAEKGQ